MLLLFLLGITTASAFSFGVGQQQQRRPQPQTHHPFLYSSKMADLARNNNDDALSLLTIIDVEDDDDDDDDFHVINNLSTQFTYPFVQYQPHPLAIRACEQLKEELLTIDSLREEPVGKMFGVLIVRIPATTGIKLGFLKAYSGTLKTPLPGFCPMVYDRLANTTDGAFSYKDGENELNELNQQVESLETDPRRKLLQEELEALQQSTTEQLKAARKEQKDRKRQRKQLRKQQKEILAVEDYQELEERLLQESAADQRHVKALKKQSEEAVQLAQNKLDNQYDIPLQQLKDKRKAKSSALTKALFEQYQFLNMRQERANLLDIFVDQPPPGGAGDCAAPKLLQWAFLKGYKPIAMAEFWWGKDSEGLRKHNFYYPSCRGKCYPILMGHMLRGMNVGPNPLLEQQEQQQMAQSHNGKSSLEAMRTVYEDEYILVVDKPAEVLSVPGRLSQDSVYTHIQKLYPNATGPLLVHRLDMSTSGLLLIAKDKETHKHLSKQFIDRSVQKRYECLLDGRLVDDESNQNNTNDHCVMRGKIELPLMSDYYNRPMQKVDWEHGKPAVTYYEVLGTTDDGQKTRVYFYPHTGRTHQLRVHAAHEQGLNLPIVGDDIYGQRMNGERLCLHAGLLKFMDKSGKTLTLTSPAPF